MVKKLYKDGKQKALSFSFDDGNTQDIRLIALLNRYSLKATFNLTGGNCKNDCFVKRENGKNMWDGSRALRECFKGHEIASHGYMHKNITTLNDEELRFEICEDIKALETAFGCKIEGYASAYGRYDDRLLALLKELGIKYHRCAHPTSDYSPCEEPLLWQPGPHIASYMNEECKKHIDGFFETDTQLAMLTIWGHSFELTDMDCYNQKDWGDLTERWDYIEDMFKNVSNKNDVWYATNIEIFKYLEAMKNAKISDTYIENNSDITLFFDVDGKTITVESKGKFIL